MKKLSELLARVTSDEDRTAEASKAEPSSEDFETLSRTTQRSHETLRPRRTLPLTRPQRLWFRCRAAVRTVLILNRLAHDIKRFGLGRNQYADEFARDELTLPTPQADRYLFLPDNNFLRVWTWIIFMLMVYSAFILPYRVCFEDDGVTDWTSIDLATDGLFFLDILVTFNSAAQLSDDTLLTERRSLAKRYLLSWFTFDLIGCLPFSLLDLLNANTVTGKYNTLLRLLRLPRLYRVTRIFRVTKVFKTLRRSETVKRVIKLLNMSSGILRLVHFGVAVIIGVHVAGCFWYLLAKIEGFTPDTWVVRSRLGDSGNFMLYLNAVYYVFTTVTTVGFGDIVPGTSVEMICAMLVMGFGIAFYSYVVSNLSTILSTLDSRSEFIKARLQALNEFAQETHLPKELHNSIRRHITLTYQHFKLSAFTRDALVNELPAYLMNEVSLHMHKKVVDQVIFFQDKNPTFLSFIIPKLKSETLRIGEFLYRQGDYADEMYYLTVGRVHLKTDDAIVFKTYIQGSYFGEIELLTDSERECTVQICSPQAEFLSLSKSNFHKVMKEFPDIGKEIRQTAHLRAIRNDEARKFAIVAAKPSAVVRQQGRKFTNVGRRASAQEGEGREEKEEHEKAVHWAEGTRAVLRPPAYRKVSSTGILKKSAKNSQVSSTISTREHTARALHIRSSSEPRESQPDDILSPKLDTLQLPLLRPVVKLKPVKEEPAISPHIVQLIAALQGKEEALLQSLELSLSMLRSVSQSQEVANEQLTKLLSRSVTLGKEQP